MAALKFRVSDGYKHWAFEDDVFAPGEEHEADGDLAVAVAHAARSGAVYITEGEAPKDAFPKSDAASKRKLRKEGALRGDITAIRPALLAGDISQEEYDAVLQQHVDDNHAFAIYLKGGPHAVGDALLDGKISDEDVHALIFTSPISPDACRELAKKRRESAEALAAGQFATGAKPTDEQKAAVLASLKGDK